jgi:hypothetical protein
MTIPADTINARAELGRDPFEDEEESDIAADRTANPQFAIEDEAAIAMLEVWVDKEHGRRLVHSRTRSLIGADWDLADVVRVIRRHGAEEAGPFASATGYRLFVNRPSCPLFFRTKKETDGRAA